MSSTKQFSDLANPGDQFAWELLWKIDAALAEKDWLQLPQKLNPPSFKTCPARQYPCGLYGTRFIVLI